MVCVSVELNSKSPNFSVFFFNRTIETVSPEQLTGSPAKKPKTDSLFKVTPEGLKRVSQLPERKIVKSPSSQAATEIHKTERTLSSNITLLRSPGANSGCDLVPSQARLFVINPQSNSTKAKTVAQTILPATTNLADSSSTVTSAVSSRAEQTENIESVTTSAVKSDSSSGKAAATSVSNLKLENELPKKENVQSEKTTPGSETERRK